MTTRRGFVALTGSAIAGTVLANAIATDAAANDQDAKFLLDKLIKDYQLKQDNKSRARLAIFVAMARVDAILETAFKNEAQVLPGGTASISPDRLDKFFDHGAGATSIFPTEINGEVLESDLDLAVRLRDVFATITGNLSTDIPIMKTRSHKG